MRIILTNAGFEAIGASCGEEAVELFATKGADLVILDVMMPGMDGFEACRRIRERSERVPVLFLSALGEISDKRQGFRTGADAYLTKPFDQEELVLNVRALLRRTSSGGGIAGSNANKVAEIGALRVDTYRREVTVGGAAVTLTPIEFEILSLLAENPGKVYSRDEIACRVWGDNHQGKDAGVPTHIRHVREKIEEDPGDPCLLKTVGRFGYRLES